jgi:hypothetical protein
LHVAQNTSGRRSANRRLAKVADHRQSLADFGAAKPA